MNALLPFYNNYFHLKFFVSFIYNYLLLTDKSLQM